jgi:hypothetical protein
MGSFTMVAIASTMFFGLGIVIGSAVTGSSGSSLAGMAIGTLLMCASSLFVLTATGRRFDG